MYLRDHRHVSKYQNTVIITILKYFLVLVISEVRLTPDANIDWSQHISKNIQTLFEQMVLKNMFKYGPQNFITQMNKRLLTRKPLYVLMEKLITHNEHHQHNTRNQN
ncbi:hypothetical protein PR048_013900 [Dryococelus australis]|uniref:Uncharacterized protein n=1 Tax=Dryococelus australis TaxID=614101 RepID=A0ABQ9HTI2_9NEOP|nr:hypothetical protein PR048_013900 [Dryococelus australis]